MSYRMSNDELQQLQTSASLATPGPWHSSGGKANARVQARVPLAGGGWASYILCAMTRSGWRGGSQVANDAYFISLLSPERMKGLVDEVLESRRLLDGLPLSAIEGGWTAKGLSDYTKELEQRLANRPPLMSLDSETGKIEPVQLNKHESTPALASVLDEMKRQDIRWGADRDQHPFVWGAILTEEVGELNQAFLHNNFGGSHAGTARHEAVQVAAVALQIIEYFDRVGETS